jgi:CDP-glucose 4,6-dehydratase
MKFWQGRRVLVTGHTGFKGAWLSLWLADAGARVTGIALEPDTEPSLFNQLGLAPDIDHRILDIRDAEGVARAIAETAPDVVLHLAAQSLVLRGYREPVDTWTVNVMGTIHLLEALRRLEKPCAAVIVTTDKVYENRNWEFGYRENDPLGGHDSYSASKAAAEIAVSCWRRSFLNGDGVRVASARAGNVIGGGDWSENRIVPDIVRALSAGRPVEVRNRGATRPWQHVLEPLGGYLHLARQLLESEDTRYQDAFNFGPDAEASRTVGELVAECLKHWPGSAIDLSLRNAPHEAGRLSLVVERARERLGWRPRWSFGRGVAETIAWYKDGRELDARRLRDFSLAQIRGFESEIDAAQ